MVGTLWASPVLAAMYFEFNPDYAESLLVASSDTVMEVFLPLNEHMSGMDFWMSNASTPGDVTLTLLNNVGTQLAVRTITVPAIADSSRGTRVHWNWPAQLAVTAAAPYRVLVTTAVPTLRLYYSGTNSILLHNASPAISYSSGRASIGGEEKEFSFTFGLYENTEGIPPQLTNIQIAQPAIGQAVLTFNANEPVDAQVEHTSGIVAYTGQQTSCIAGISPCSVTLSVTPGTDHTYTLTARDSWGNATVATGTFTSVGAPPSTAPSPTPTPTSGGGPTPTPTPDTVPPILSNLRVVNITATSAGFAWTTNEAANGIVVVQSMPFLISAGGNSDNTLELEHYVTVNNIGSDALYLARVTTSDDSGNSALATISFQTLAVPPPAPSGGSTPTPSATPGANPTPTPTVSVAPSGGVAQWSPPASGAPENGYRIDIIGSDGKLIRTIRTSDTTADLGEIPDGATILVYADNDGVYEKVAAPHTIHRGSFFEQLISALPYILGGLVVSIGVIVGILMFRQRRKAALPPAGPPPPLTGAQPNPSAF